MYNWTMDCNDFTETLVGIEDGEDSVRVKVSWNDLTSTDRNALPSDNYKLVYALDLGFFIQSKDWNTNLGDDVGSCASILSGMNAEVFNEDQAWGYDGGTSRYCPLWNSWSGTNRGYISNTEFNIPLDLVSTLEGSTYTAQYDLMVRPMLVSKTTDYIVWEGDSFFTQFQVGNVDPWSVTINGTIAIPSNYPEGETRDGTVKVGIFKDSEWWNWQNSDSREPVLITTIGDNGAFEFPQLNYEDVANSHYRLIIWHDLSDEGDVNKVDMASYENEWGWTEVYHEERWEECGFIEIGLNGVEYEEFAHYDDERQFISFTIDDENIQCNPFWYYEHNEGYEDEFAELEQFEEQYFQHSDGSTDGSTAGRSSIEVLI